MKKLLVFVMALALCACMTTPAMADSEITIGHTLSEGKFLPEQSFGILTDLGDESLRAGVGRFGNTFYAHILFERNFGPCFIGFGPGWVTEHARLDKHFQFTTTAGIKYKVSKDHSLVFRISHRSNGAGIFHRGNRAKRDRNVGVNIFSAGLTF